MQPHNIPQFVELLKERKFPIDGMQMEVITATPNGTNGFKGIVTMNGDHSFTLCWYKWECFLLLFSTLEWQYMFKYLLPYCLGLRKMQPYMVNSDMGKRLQVTRSLQYK